MKVGGFGKVGRLMVFRLGKFTSRMGMAGLVVFLLRGKEVELVFFGG
jgi:hypothetical protein